MESERSARSPDRTTFSPISGTQWMIESDGHEAVVVEVGGGLRAYRVDGSELLDGYGPDEVCPGAAGQVLAPWPNRIRDGRYTFHGESYQLPLTEPAFHNAIHGLVNWLPWRCVEQSAAELVVECDLWPLPGYPWPLRLRTRWSVGPGGLRAEHEATNLGASACPFGLATHPYLQLPGVDVAHTTLHVPAHSRLLTDGRGLPIGAAKVTAGEFDFTEPRAIGSAVLDTAFADLDRDRDGVATVGLSSMDGRATLAVWADEAFGWWQVFTGDTLPGARRRRSVAVEPMTCPPDAFRSGRDLVLLPPGETWRAAWGIAPRIGEG
ncbi:MAG TPA: aldose 1-epimerase family protein [Micromonosporaceae bacterium]